MVHAQSTFVAIMSAFLVGGCLSEPPSEPAEGATDPASGPEQLTSDVPASDVPAVDSWLPDVPPEPADTGPVFVDLPHIEDVSPDLPPDAPSLPDLPPDAPVDLCADVDCEEVPCAVGTCDPTTGECVYAASGADCISDDECDDENGCTIDTCEVDCSCSHAPTPGALCDDDDPCTEDDVCTVFAACVGIPKSCDDGIACTVDACSPATGECTHDATMGGCMEDWDCNDGNPCTADACTPICTCVNEPLPDAVCDDGDACTLDDVCEPNGWCIGTLKVCDDGIPCTFDACNPVDGACFHDDSNC